MQCLGAVPRRRPSRDRVPALFSTQPVRVEVRVIADAATVRIEARDVSVENLQAVTPTQKLCAIS